jgi:serine/threonine-protein kinase
MPSDRFDSALEACAILESAAAELGAEPTAQVLRDALIRARLVDGSPSKMPAARAVARSEGRVGSTVAGLCAALALIIGGGAVIQLLSGRAVGTAVAAQAGRRLDLLPEGRAFLRVVAHPWANVIVDGQQVETTPFARAIPLSAGSHYVRLEHPNAPVERRTIELTPGETRLLDVTLKVSAPAPSASVSALEAARQKAEAEAAQQGTP